jgi:hypothetical protein
MLGGLLSAGALCGASPAWAMGEQDRFTIGLLHYRGGNPDPRPNALRRLLQELEKRTSVEVHTVVPQIQINDPAALFQCPMVVLAGDQGFPEWSEREVDYVRQYLQSGGFLVVDSSEGLLEGPFISSVKRELKRIWAGEKVKRMGKDHVLYKSFYLLREPYGRVMVHDGFEGIEDHDRWSVVICYNDMMGALARDNFGEWEYEVAPGGERQREMTYRLGINLAMYALCIHYKEDQVHIPFILKRRKWRVDD